MPPTERRGRVHSSTVTVAVMGETAANLHAYQCRDPDDYSLEWFSGTGCGGQYRNKHLNSARIVHRPTGITRSAQTRSRENSRKAALAALNAELDRLANAERNQKENTTRRTQVGSGERSDKRRTYRFQAGLALDHVSGRTADVAKVLGGRFDLLWN